tara:strand:+ start:425 stop:1522 length:1098 start_codon:yes stop_codon:yes gene_type:complete
MGISQEAFRARNFVAQNAPQFAVGAEAGQSPLNQVSNPSAADEIRNQAAATAEAQTDDIERIVADGEVAFVQGSLSERERATLVASLEGNAFDKQRIAIESGTSTRDGLIGSNLKTREARLAQTRDKANADARTQALLALQAQLDALDAEIAALDDEVNALDQLLGIIDSGETLDPNNPAHRRILEKSGIPPEKWDNITREDIEAAKREREAERDAKQEEYDRVEGIMKNGTDAEIKYAAENLNIDAVRKMRDEAPGQNQDKVENTLNQRYNGGNAAQLNDSVDEQFIKAGNNSLGGKSLLSPGTSVASVLAPGLAAQPPQITPQYNEASRGEENAPRMQRLAQVTQEQEQESPAAVPPPGTTLS